MQRLHALMTHQIIIILSLLLFKTMANPIGSPEIISKSTVHNVNGNIQHEFKASAPQTILKTYSSSYVAGPKSTDNSQPPFKPSFKLSEDDFRAQATSNINSNSDSSTSDLTATPLLMQYMPQLLQEGGVQYLQLIPTRPLIVPIGPYINAAGTPTASAYSAPQLNFGNSIAEYAPHAAPIYTNLPNTAIQPAITNSLMELQSNNADSLRNYADALQHYRNNFRINREIKSTTTVIDPSLNLNEYIPVNPQSLQSAYVRGRP